LALAHFILNRLPIPKGLEAFSFDARVMDKQILSAIVGCNKPIALLFIEPLYCTSRHALSSIARSFPPQHGEPSKNLNTALVLKK